MELVSALFLVSSLLIIVTPGQDLVLVLSRSLSGGSAAGIATAAGVSIGLLGHTVLASLGLGMLLQNSAILFSAIKYIGAVYLVWIGWKMIRHSGSHLILGGSAVNSPMKVFAQGMVSNLSNPKITLFYFAYLPQFLPADTASHSAGLFILGTVFALLTFLVKAPIGYFGGRFSTFLRNNPAILRGVYRSSGIMLIGLGVRLAFSSRE